MRVVHFNKLELASLEPPPVVTLQPRVEHRQSKAYEFIRPNSSSTQLSPSVSFLILPEQNGKDS